MILISFFLCFLSCVQSSKRESESNQPTSRVTRNEIVFIFKKQNQDESVTNKSSLQGSDIYFTEKNDFLVRELSPLNFVKDDTITQPIISDKICLAHRFNKVNTLQFEFQKGDTVVFDYSKGYPKATVKNRKVLQYDLNFQTGIKIKKPLSIFEFLTKNKRIRSKSENVSYFKDLKVYTIRVNQILDSLLNEKRISQSNYEMYKGANKFFEINTNKTLFNTVTNDDLKRDDLLYSSAYRYFLENYVVYKFKLKTEFESDPMSCNSMQTFDLIEKSTLFSEKTKKYLLYTHLVAIAEKYSIDHMKLYFKRFQELFHDNLLNEKIRDNYLLDFEGLKDESNSVYLSDLNKQTQTLDSIISRNKGKVIYVDFWASWCMPCRAAMPKSRVLQKEFKDKAVVFVFISIDTDFEKWKNASQKEKLTENPNSLIDLNYPNANFFKNLQVKSIPRYLIYDKAGKLVQKNAPGPESQQVIAEINKYLIE